MADMMLVNTVFGPWTQCLASFGGVAVADGRWKLQVLKPQKEGRKKFRTLKSRVSRRFAVVYQTGVLLLPSSKASCSCCNRENRTGPPPA